MKHRRVPALDKETECRKSAFHKSNAKSTSPTAPQRVLAVQQAIGNRAAARLIQAKLKISQPNDPMEKEADRIADLIMRIPNGLLGADEDEKGRVGTQLRPLEGSRRFRQILREIETEEGGEAKHWDGEKGAPAFALPLKYRFYFDVNLNAYVDYSSGVAHRKTDMDGFYKEAEEGKTFWVELLCVLSTNLEKLEKLPPYEVAQVEGWDVVNKSVWEVWQSCVDVAKSVGATTIIDPYSPHFCRINMPEPSNPFYCFPFWQHEKVHQRQCFTYLSEARSRHPLVARVEAFNRYVGAKAWVRSEIDAYRVAIKELGEELETYRTGAFEPSSGLPMSIEEGTFGIRRKQSEEEAWVQRDRLEGTPALERNIRELAHGGQPLCKSIRAFFEMQFGYDLSTVRLHTDARAAEAARVLKARAFTVGHDLILGQGQYAPETSAGRRLLAHELAHVLQQNSPVAFSPPRVQRQAEEVAPAGGIVSIEEPLFEIREVLEESAENLIENLVEEAVPQTRMLILTVKLSNAFGEGLERGILNARKRLDYDAIVTRLAGKSDYDEKDIEDFQHLRRWQKNAVDAFPDIVREGLSELLVAVANELIEEGVQRLVSGFAEHVADWVGDKVGDFLTGDIIEAIDIIEQPIEDLVQSIIRESGRHLTVAFSQAMATTMAESALTEMEARAQLESETEGETADVRIAAELLREAVFEAGLPFEQVRPDVDEKLDALAAVIEQPDDSADLQRLREEFSRDMILALQAISEFESRFRGLGAMKRPFTGEDERLQKKIVKTLENARGALIEIDVILGARMIVHRIPTLRADINAITRKIYELRD